VSAIEEAERYRAAKAREDNLKAALSRTMRQLATAKASKQDLVDAVYRAARDGISALELKPVIAPAIVKAAGSPEVAVAMLGDWQLGKRTPTYNSRVCEERIELYGDKLLHLTTLQRANHPVREARVWLLGDMIEGVTVFPGQQWQVDASLYRQITLDGPRIVGNLLRRLLGSFDRVHVVAVIGNHGRFGRRGDFDPETNGDRMLYRIVQQLLESEKRLTWTIPDGMGERHWYAVDRIGRYSCLLFHGDQLAGRLQGARTIIGMKRLINGWKSGGIPDSFDDVAYGHWHETMDLPLNGRCVARCVGSPESYNTFAQEALAAMSCPAQRLMFVNPEKGRVSAEYRIWLDGKAKAA
jgi:hypothetical protein